MTIVQDSFSSSPQNSLAPGIRIGYERGRLKRIIYFNMVMIICGAYFIIRPPALPYSLAIFIIVISIFTMFTPYATRENRYVLCAIFYAVIVFWIITMPLATARSTPFVFLRDTYLPNWGTQGLFTFFILNACWSTIWARSRYRLPANHPVLFLNNGGLSLEGRAKVIPWNKIDSATIIYNPAFPAMQLGIRIKAHGVPGYSSLPSWTGRIPRKGIINIPFTLINDSPKLFTVLSAHLGNRLHP